uniref:Uncharacterized protein n=1 Tax=Globodera rostochiensis TaxID=31243 RepID=A0A914I4K1_GLORO
MANAKRGIFIQSVTNIYGTMQDRNMRRPVVVLVLLAILGLFACCAAAGGNSWWKKLSTNSRKDQPEGSNTQSSNPPETPYYPDMSNIPQTTEAEHTYPIYYEPDPINVAATHSTFRDIVQQHTGQHRSTNFDQSHYPQHDSPYYPDMSNIPQSTNFNQSHHPYPDMSNIPQSTNFTQHASHYDQGMSSTIQPKTNKPKRWCSNKQQSQNTQQPRRGEAVLSGQTRQVSCHVAELSIATAGRWMVQFKCCFTSGVRGSGRRC